MADRSVNININYKVNTADIDKAKAASKAAQTATDNLRKASKDYGDTAKKAGGDASNAIKKITDSTQDASKSTKDLAGHFGDLAAAVKGFITIAAIKQLASMAIEATRLAGNVEGVQRAFDNAFPNSVKVLNELRAATRGTITDFELMQRTLQATNLGVAVEQLPILFEFAAARAQQTGESVDYLVDSIVRGIGRKSILVLDNLGLSATRLKEQFNGASLASQSVADVTVGVAAIAKVELEKMGGYVETGATKVARLEAAWEQFKISVSKRIESSATITFFTDVLNDIGKMIAGEKALGEVEAKNRASREIDILMESDEYQLLKDNNEAKIKFLSLELIKRVELLNAKKKDIDLINQQISAQDGSTQAGGIAISRLEKLKKQQEGGNATTQEGIEILRKYIIELRKLDETGGDEKQLGIIARKKEEIKGLQDQLEETNKQGDLGVGGKLVVALEKAQKELDALLGKANEVETEQQKKLTEYLAYLSDLEMFQTTEMLKERVAARKEAAKEEEKLEKEKQEKILADQKKAAEEAARIEKHKEELIKQAKQDAVDGVIDISTNLATSLIQNDANQYNQRISLLNDYYDEQIRLAGDNDRAKETIERKREREIDKARREAFRKNKEAQKLTAIINAAGAAARAFVDYEYPVSIAIAALAGAQALAQVAIIDSQQPKFKDGVINLQGPGTSTSDSIQARLSKGESVMTAKETFRAKGVLEMVRANKLDDSILKQLQLTSQGVKVVGMDDKRIVKAIEKQKQPDFIKIGGLLYQLSKSQDGQSKTIRRKSIPNG